MSLPATAPITHRSVLAIAVPIMLSNVSEPLIGVVNTAVIGQLPDPYYIGAIAVGALLFSFIFWGFGFLRLSTGGLSAQAVGAGNSPELVAVLLRALVIAVVAGAALIALSPVIREVAFDLIGGSAEVRRHGETYFNYRIWSAPFAFVNYCVMGWYIGQAKAKLTFLVQLFLNVTNMALSVTFVQGMGMTSDGVGLAALIAEIAAAMLALGLAFGSVRRMAAHIDRTLIFNTREMRRTLAMNGDVMIRTLCLVFAFTWFTARGARAGDVTIAANAVLLNLFEVAAYMIDGFSYASEALVGQSVGARNRERFRAAVWFTSVWAMVVGAICMGVIWFAGPMLIDLISVNPDVREAARHYLFWAALTPLLGTVCFQFDGIFTGAMATKDMRNMMIVSLAIYLAAWWLLERAYGNHGLWAALCIFFIARGVTFASRMPAIERRIFHAV
ncbi:MAG: MATE family efflux transporter [Rhizobiales bacterium]|nr:MATE family efflux transporter [Hyphomicrobiales bacterium]